MSGSIAVTGAKGFAGGHLLARLGARAISLDADVTDIDALTKAVAATSAESVVHLAAASSAGASWTDVGEAWRVNALGTVNLLDAVQSHAPDARVRTSSRVPAPTWSSPAPSSTKGPDGTSGLPSARGLPR